MLKIKDEGIILEKTNLEFENKSVFNPACIQVKDITHMFYRAVSQYNISSLGYCQLKDNKIIKRLERPVLFPEHDYERRGLEDPRITFLEGTYYLFYTAYDGESAHVAYAVSNDLISFTKKGLISPSLTYDEASEIFHQVDLKEEYFIWKLYFEKEFKGRNMLWEKDASLFPKKINNKFALLHRIRPDIQIIYFKNFKDLTNDYWKTYLKELNKYIVLEPRFEFENRYIGGGCPPIETEDGWLVIYHAVEDNPLGKYYHACAALLDLKNPLKVLGRLRKPLFSPIAPYEKSGFMDNVVFPTGAVVIDNRLYIYYGCADNLIAGKSINLKELLNELKKSP
jgi:predicted GH43/DUF377 family glycosyl hydrolase